MTFSLDFSPLLPYWPVFLKGAWLTLKMTTVAVFFGVILGTLVAFAKRGKNRLLSRVCSIYIEAVRNTPFLVQIFLLYFGLAGFGVRMPTFAAAALAMIINIGAYGPRLFVRVSNRCRAGSSRRLNAWACRVGGLAGM